MASGLSGFTVGVTAARRATEQAAMLAGLGANVIVAPVVRAEHRSTSRSGSGAGGAGDWPEDPGPAERLVASVCEGAVDAITFTTGRAVRNFMAFADRSRRGRNVLAALNDRMVVACAGPGPAAAAEEEGIRRPAHRPGPQLGPLVSLVHDELLDRRRRYRVGHSELILQGSLVLVDGRAVRLTDHERALLAKLAEHPGTMVSRRVLLRHVWKDPSVDPDELERAVKALRGKLGPSAPAVETAVRRGYRLRAVEASVGTD